MFKPNQNNKIIILDANSVRRDHLKLCISKWDYVPIGFESVETCLENLKVLNPALVICGLLFEDEIIRLVHALKMINRNLPVLIISNNLYVRNFVNNREYVNISIINQEYEPFEVHNAMKKYMNRPESNKFINYPVIVGRNPVMMTIKRKISRLNDFTEPILIYGQKGTGKDLVARTLHVKSEMEDEPFIKINVEKLSHRPLESDIYGYGSEIFLMEQSENSKRWDSLKKGTIYLDKIEKMSSGLQARMVHFLERGCSSNSGSQKGEKPEIKIIASSGDNLFWLVEKGKFRKDLFFRLNTINIEMPPLTKRVDDIPFLLDYFIDKYCIESGKSSYKLSKNTRNMLCRYYWPGNVKELKKVVQFIVTTGNEEKVLNTIYTKDQRLKIWELSNYASSIGTLSELLDIREYLKKNDDLSLKDIRKKIICHTEKKLIYKVLKEMGWNRKKTASMLNISYKTMLNKIKAYNITC